MKELSSLTYREKILLYLKRYHHQSERTERSESVTQKGISQNIGLSRTHVSRVLNSLQEEDMIEEEMASVKEHGRKLKTYFLTEKGKNEAERIRSQLSDISITVIEGDNEKEISLPNIEKRTDGRLDLTESISILESKENDVIDLRQDGVIEPVKMIDEAPETKEFYGRKAELESMKDWLEDETPFLSVLGQRGYGTSTLTSKFVKSLKERHMLWIELKEKSEETIKERISSFLEEIEDSFDYMIEELLSKEALLIFDNYYDVEEGVVSFLSELLERIDREDPLKIIVTGRKGTPVYERFYRPEHIKSGLVRELKISPLGKKEAKKILKTNLKEDAMKRIMMFTKGSPLLLKLLREGEESKLTEITPWEEEQISLLMYLKTETKQ